MTPQAAGSSPSQQRKSALGLFYVLIFTAIATFVFGVRPGQPPQAALMALGIFLSCAGIWSFVRFLRVGDPHQKRINHEATSFAFAASLLLTLIVGLLQRFGFLSGNYLLVPALMVAFWSLGLFLSARRYQ